MDGQAAVKKAFAKFGMTYTPPVVPASTSNLSKRHANKAAKELASMTLDPATEASANGQVGEATAKPEENGALYLTQVNVGGQTVNLDFDTGSSDLWIFDKAKTGRGFDSTKSTSFKAMTGSTFMISYGDGSTASGNVGTDVVKIGAATVPNQAVELANSVSAQFQQEQTTDGLLGLAFSKLNTVKPTAQKTFFDMIQPQLASPLFTVNLLLDGSGEYEFGTVDSSKYTGQLQYVDVNSTQGFWQFASASFKVGDTVGTNTAPHQAIADTGTSLMLVDPNVAAAYYAKVQGAQNDPQQGGYTYPCTSKMPDFSVALGTTGQYVTVPGSAVTYQAQGGTCFGGIQSNQGQPVQIYGDIMLKTQFVVFEGASAANGNKPRLGFANSKGATAGAASASPATPAATTAAAAN
ncbi:aspergillopepsin-F [Myriangium duriaei CBS 260.36]|uniref:Aspergillopepsin-F n=1 Tax=Myriangium duriaei CBS 260.36 TaxID=1168546 RepID=A0A9P4J4N1_9PEZI|nr:aspergillopepsin-F [Myriangium duriaei CBS 260.36]